MNDEIFPIVKAAVDECDVFGLLRTGCPDDEYDIESEQISRMISRNDDVQKIAEVMCGVMNRSFAENTEAGDYIQAAQKIRAAL